MKGSEHTRKGSDFLMTSVLRRSSNLQSGNSLALRRVIPSVRFRDGQDDSLTERITLRAGNYRDVPCGTAFPMQCVIHCAKKQPVKTHKAHSKSRTVGCGLAPAIAFEYCIHDNVRQRTKGQMVHLDAQSPASACTGQLIQCTHILRHSPASA